MTAELSFAARYRAANLGEGFCPIEQGVFASSAENECSHGRLRTDPTPPCGCWEGFEKLPKPESGRWF